MAKNSPAMESSEEARKSEFLNCSSAWILERRGSPFQ
jgi:hypothetical protein